MNWNLINSDVLAGLARLPDQSVHCIVTSPPYWSLRDYKVDGQLGLEPTFGEYLVRMVAIFRELKRVLRDDGTLWLNMGDNYSTGGGKVGTRPGGGKRGDDWPDKAEMTPLNRMVSATGLPAGNLIGQPWRVAFALQEDGWVLRQDVVWHKKNPMPESVKSRPTRSHEYIFQFTKNLGDYFYDHEAVKMEASPNTHLRISRAQSSEMRRLTGDAEDQTRREAHGLHTPRENMAKPTGWFDGPGRHDQVKDGNYGNRAGYGKTAGKNSRMNVDQDPAHLANNNPNNVRGVGWGRAEGEERWTGNGVNPKARTVNMNERNGHRPRQNPSFSAAVVEKVATRALRSVWSFATQALDWTICKSCEETYDRGEFKALKRTGDDIFCRCGLSNWHGHFASFPERLPEYCILASCPPDGIVLDPFSGSGTTGVVTLRLGRSYFGIELSRLYYVLSERRIRAEKPLLYAACYQPNFLLDRQQLLT